MVVVVVNVIPYSSSLTRQAARRARTGGRPEAVILRLVFYVHKACIYMHGPPDGVSKYAD